MRQSGHHKRYGSASASPGRRRHHRSDKLKNIIEFTGVLPSPDGKGMHLSFVCAFPTYDAREMPLRKRVSDQPLVDRPWGFYRALILRGYDNVQTLSLLLNYTLAQNLVKMPEHKIMLARLHTMIGRTVNDIDADTVWSVYQLKPSGVNLVSAYLALEQAYGLVINCDERMFSNFDYVQSGPIAWIEDFLPQGRTLEPLHIAYEHFTRWQAEQARISKLKTPMASASTITTSTTAGIGTGTATASGTAAPSAVSMIDTKSLGVKTKKSKPRKKEVYRPALPALQETNGSPPTVSHPDLAAQFTTAIADAAATSGTAASASAIPTVYPDGTVVDVEEIIRKSAEPGKPPLMALTYQGEIQVLPTMEELQKELVILETQLELQISKKKYYKKKCLFLLQIMEEQTIQMTSYISSMPVSDDDDDKKDDTA